MITTDRLIIRKALESDSKFVAEIQTNEAVQKYMGGVITGFEKALSHIKNNPAILNSFYVIVLKKGNINIGLISFMQNEEVKESELSIALMPSYQGEDYGPEAMRDIVEYWIIENKTDHIYTTVYPENNNCISMLEDNNFRFIKKYKDRISLKLLYKYEKHT